MSKVYVGSWAKMLEGISLEGLGTQSESGVVHHRPLNLNPKR